MKKLYGRLLFFFPKLIGKLCASSDRYGMVWKPMGSFPVDTKIMIKVEARDKKMTNRDFCIQIQPLIGLAKFTNFSDIYKRG